MCGIAGFLGSGIGGVGRELADSMINGLAHRGPDGQGLLILTPDGPRLDTGRDDLHDALGFLAHRRLSILDLSNAGAQPMRTADGSHFIVFNGEIYNYRELRSQLRMENRSFRGQSDTEVLLHAFREWGPSALSRLIGMFAFALLDTRARKLFLARDYFGIKPLYYAHFRDQFAFASEIKVLLEIPGVGRQVHSRRLYEYLRFAKTDSGCKTLFQDVLQVPPGHFLEVSLDLPRTMSLHRYWKLEPRRRPQDISFQEASARVREMFLENIRLHLRSDVLVGAALSGGIDSSAIVGAMRAVDPDLEIHTFSYVADDPALSEERWIDQVNAQVAAVVHKVRPSPEELAEDLDSLIDTQDEPFGSTSIYAQYRVFRLAREAGIKVMLDGQGADEMLGGYRPHLAFRFASLVRQGKWPEAARFLLRVSRLPGTGGMSRLLLQAGSPLLPRRLAAWAKQLLGESLMPSWLNAIWFKDQKVTPGLQALSDSRPTCHSLRKELEHSLTDTSLPMLLRYEDRNSMAHSIESRVPFLTPALAQFLLSLPEEYLIGPDGTTKRVFRHAMRGIVPDAILNRRDKIGFATPERDWLTTLRPWVDRTLTSDAASGIPALDLNGMKKEWQAVVEGRKRFDFRVWRWVNVIRWAERYAVTFDN